MRSGGPDALPLHAAHFTPVSAYLISFPIVVSRPPIVGIQFGSSVGKEGLLLRLAAQLEQANPWIAFKPDFRSA